MTVVFVALILVAAVVLGFHAFLWIIDNADVIWALIKLFVLLVIVIAVVKFIWFLV